MRRAVCENLDWFGIRLDADANAKGKGEMSVHAGDSRVQIWTMPTNEEIVVARQTRTLLETKVG